MRVNVEADGGTARSNAAFGEEIPARVERYAPERDIHAKLCQSVDFGAWASEAYGVEVKPSEDDDPDADTIT